MRALTKKLATVSALALFGMTGAQASIVAASAAGGSEAILTFVNANGDSISQDLGEQAGAIAAGDSYTLGASVLSFISAAGGLANVTYGVIAGSTTGRSYLTSSGSATFADDVQVAESAKSLWASSLSSLIGNLNTGDASGAAVNNAYGPFLAGSGSPNYLDGLHDNWQSGDFQFSNLAPGTDTLYLYAVQFTSASIGLRSFTPFNGGLFGNLADGKLTIGPVVPVPAAVWLFGSAVGLLSVTRRRLAA